MSLFAWFGIAAGVMGLTLMFACTLKSEHGFLANVTVFAFSASFIASITLLIATFIEPIPLGDEVTIPSTTVQTDYITTLLFTDVEGKPKSIFLDDAKAYASTNITIHAQMYKNSWGIKKATKYTTNVK